MVELDAMSKKEKKIKNRKAADSDENSLTRKFENILL